LFLKTKKAISQELKSKYGNDCLIFSNLKGWITEEILLEWLEKIWLNLNLSPGLKPLLLFDHCKVHTSKKILDFLKNNNILYDIIPAGTTGYLQPLDVSINKPLKTYIKQKFDHWYGTYGISDVNKTPKGYLRPPSYDLLIEWTIKACKEISFNTVTHSFKTTGNLVFFLDINILGISLSIDGLENHLFNRKVLENEALQVNINEIISKKNDDPYNDAESLKTFIEESSDVLTYDIKDENQPDDLVSVASSHSSELDENKEIDEDMKEVEGTIISEKESKNEDHKVGAPDNSNKPQGILKRKLDSFLQGENNQAQKDENTSVVKKSKKNDYSPLPGQKKNDCFFKPTYIVSCFLIWKAYVYIKNLIKNFV